MKERIEVDPNIHFGKPCIAGTRIPVLNILELLSEGLTFADMLNYKMSIISIKSFVTSQRIKDKIMLTCN